MPETVPAVNRACARDDHQRPSRVFLQHTRRKLCRLFGHRIESKTRNRTQLLIERQHLPEQWIVRIAGTHPSHESPRHNERKNGRRGRRLPGKLRRQIEQLTQFSRIAHRLLQDLPPACISGRRQGADNRGVCG